MEPESSLPQSQVGLCHHDMARPQVADAGTASNMKGIYEYIEYAVTDSRQGWSSRLGEVLTSPHRKNIFFAVQSKSKSIYEYSVFKYNFLMEMNL